MTLRPHALPVVLLALILTTLCRADGLIIIPHPTPVPHGHFPFAPLEVTYHHVTVEIRDHVAVTHVDQEFHNPNDQRLEGTYVFPLPPGAHIDKFSMDVNGKMTEAELLPADKARKMYEDIVRSMKDPALLEYTGRDAFRARIFPIEPRSKKQIKLTYTQLLKPDAELTEYVYTLNTEKFSARPLKDISVKVDLKTTRPVKSVYCPSHNVDVKRHSDTHTVVGYEEHDVRPDTDFRLIFTQDKDPVGLSLLTYRNSPDDGYFLLMASSGVDVADGMVQPKDVAFVFDTSGSMAGPKMEQARKALQFCLANLNPQDRFEIIRFSTEAENLFGSLQPADKEHLDKAAAFIRSLKPIGGTAIADALSKAKDLARSRTDGSRPYAIIFLTDGQPTIGETNEDRLVDSVFPKGHDGDLGVPFTARIFPFGIGTDINTHLLDRLANDSRAFSQYVLPEEDIELKVSSFYTRIQSPVLTDLKLDFTGDVRVTQLYPASLPDLYKGETLVVFGRYAGSGPSAARITGSLRGNPVAITQDVSFTESDASRDFIPHLWATRRVGYLLDEIRLRGESPELKDEVTRLAREHGIVTPYTAYLILEDEARRNVPLASRTMRELGDDRTARDNAKAFYESARGGSARLEKAGERAVANSAVTQQLKQGLNQQQTYAGAALAKPQVTAGGQVQQPNVGYRVAQNYAQQAKVINGRAFFQNGTTWTDATIQREQSRNRTLKQQQLRFNTPEYFALLQSHPEASRWLALGSEVDLLIGDTIYNIR